MPFTYTFTARNRKNPEKVITFTLYDDYLTVNLTGLIDSVSEFVKEKEEESRKEVVKSIISKQSGAAIYKVLERLSGPVHISDVNPYIEEGQFNLTFWKRLAGLRVAPITISVSDVDNPQAATQFIETLIDRQKETVKPGTFAGPLDYWATWVGLLIGLIVLIRWLKKDRSQFSKNRQKQNIESETK